MSYKVKNIYYLALYCKSLLIPEIHSFATSEYTSRQDDVYQMEHYADCIIRCG